jgi:hypothetical protein
MSFHVVILEEALCRHAKARDVIHRLRLYPESEMTGSRKKVACWPACYVLPCCYGIHSQKTDSYFKAVPFRSLLPSKLDDSSVRLRLAAPGLLYRCQIVQTRPVSLALPHRRGSPGFAFELCSRSLSGSYSPKFPKTSNFRFLSLNTQATAGNSFHRLFRTGPVESNGEQLQTRPRRYSNRARSFECV